MTHGTIKAILLSGPPGCGETTVIRRLVELSCPSWTGSTATGWPPRPRRPPAGRRAAAGGPGAEGGACSALRWAGRWACWLVQLLRSTDGALKEVAAACRAVRAALAGLWRRAEQRRGRPPPE